MSGLTVIETHPVQYHAPVYRALQQRFGIPVTAVYGSDFSVSGYRDREFGAEFKWDTDLLSGYSPVFLSRVSGGGARPAGQVPSRGLREALARIGPRAVMITGYSPRFYGEAFCEARRAGCRVLFRGETTDHALRRGPLKRWARDSALRWLYDRCARLLYVGRRSFGHFKRLGCPDDKMAFSPYCVDTSAFRCGPEFKTALRASVRNELGIQEDESVVLFSGKLSRRKGPDLLIEAIKGLRPVERERTAAVFLGDGSMKERLKDLAGKEPRINVRFAGFRNQSELSRYYHAADILALPSRYSETWGLVVNEALHHGVPCAVSDAVGCAPDLVEPGATGEVFTNGSAGGLTQAVIRCLKLARDPLTGERCREKAAGYSVERAAGGVAEAYRAVADG